MSKKQEDFRKNLLAKIHIHRRYKEIKENGCWEEWCLLRYGCNSTKFLSINELKEVLDILNGMAKDRDYVIVDIVGRAQTAPNKHGLCTKAQRLKIIALCEEANMKEKAFCAFAYKQIKKHILGFALLDKLQREEATKIIVGLEKVLKWSKKHARYANNTGYKLDKKEQQ